MIRNIEKTVEQYRTLSQSNGNGNAYTFHPLELKAIVDKANYNPYDAAYIAMEFAYMIGYRKGRKDQKEGKAVKRKPHKGTEEA